MFWFSRGAIITGGIDSIKILNAQPTRNASIFSKMGFYLNYMNIRTVWCTELHSVECLILLFLCLELCQASAVMLSKKKNKKKKPGLYRSFFPVSAKELNKAKAQHLDNCYHLLAQLSCKSDNIQNTDAPLYFAFFGNHDDIQRLFDAEGKYMTLTSKWK